MNNIKQCNLFITLLVLLLAGCSNTLDTGGDDPYSTEITYLVQGKGDVHLWIENSYKTKVATLVDEEKTPGWHSAKFDAVDASGNNLPEGIYTYRFETENQSISRFLYLNYR